MNQRGSIIPVIAFLFGAAVVVTIFGYMLWPKDEEIGLTNTPFVVKNVNGNANQSTNVNTNSNTNVNATPATEVLPAGVKRYTSEALGVTFTYLASGQNSVDTPVEDGDKIYVGGKPNGQWVEVMTKDSADTLAEAITKKFLSGIDSSRCSVKDLTHEGSLDAGMPSTVSLAIISFPHTATNDEPWWTNTDCPQQYRETNGVRFFWMDSAHPDKLLFFSIGQYGIMGLNDNYMTLWQSTVRIVATDPTAGWKTYTNSSVGYSVKYPASWVVSDCQQIPSFVIFDSKKVTCGSEALGIFDIVLDAGGSTSSWKKSLSNTTESTITIDGIMSSRITGTVSEGMDFGKKDVVFVTKGSLTIRIQYNNKTDGADQQTFNSLLSTFIFTK